MTLKPFSPGQSIQPPKKILHFAYGANMNPAQMGERCSRAKVVAVAGLTGYSLGFFDRTGIWDGGMEAAVSDPGHVLWGVLYELSVADAESLDSWQDVRLDGAGPYFHYPVTVTDTEGREWKAAIYKKDGPGQPRPPSRECLEFIIEGAKANGLPGEYIEELQAILSVPASYPVPKIPQGGAPSTSCSECDLDE